jgi:hypothetical protein
LLKSPLLTHYYPLRCRQNHSSRAQLVSLNSTQSEALIQASKALIFGSLNEIPQNTNDSYTNKRRTTYSYKRARALYSLSYN